MTASATPRTHAGRWPSAEELILAYLQENPEITNAQARALTDITSDIDMKKVFYRLRDRGLLKRVEGRRGSSAAWQGVEAQLGSSDVYRLYGEARGYRVGLLACLAQPQGAKLKVVVSALNSVDTEPVAVVDVPDTEAEADRIGSAVLRAFQVTDRQDR